jgi:hypothetical protein
MTENDCESKAHGIVALYLAIKQCSKKTVQATREYVWTNVMQIKGGVSSMPKFGNTAALSSLDAFVDHMDTHYNSPNTPVEGSAESMLDAITTVVMWMSKYSAVHHNLGLAYAANPMQKMTPEALAARHPGGHSYAQYIEKVPAFSRGIKETSALVEGTAAILNRMNFETPVHTKSAGTLAQGLANTLEWTLRMAVMDMEDDAKGADAQGADAKKFAAREWHETRTWNSNSIQMPIAIKPQMSTSKTHTDMFYGKQCTASFAMSYKDAVSTNKPMGAYVFTKNTGEGGGEYVFGAEPENMDSPLVAYSYVEGGVADKMLSEKATLQQLAQSSMQGSQSAASVPRRTVMNPNMESLTLTSALKASILSMREQTGQRVPFGDWKIFMDRVYGTQMSIPAVRDMSENDAFDLAGRTCVAVVTFKDAKHMQEMGGMVEDMWRGLWGDVKKKTKGEWKKRTTKTNLKQHVQALMHTALLSQKELACMQHVVDTLDAFPGGQDAFEASSARTLNTIILSIRIKKGVQGSFPAVAEQPAQLVRQ